MAVNHAKVSNQTSSKCGNYMVREKITEPTSTPNPKITATVHSVNSVHSVRSSENTKNTCSISLADTPELTIDQLFAGLGRRFY